MRIIGIFLTVYLEQTSARSRNEMIVVKVCSDTWLIKAGVRIPNKSNFWWVWLIFYNNFFSKIYIIPSPPPLKLKKTRIKIPKPEKSNLLDDQRNAEKTSQFVWTFYQKILSIKTSKIIDCARPNSLKIVYLWKFLFIFFQ